MVRDSTGGIDSIVWNVYGKIERINKHDGTIITYTYNASGNRIGKVVTGAASGNGETWYVHDASGNVMSVYTVNDNTVNSGALTLSEQDLYGSSRLGLYKPNLNLATYTAPSLISMNGLGSVGYNNTFTRGKKFFELNNHLGNVLVTVSDKKTGVDGDNNSVIDYYLPDIVSANSYYPFGMQMPGRTFTASSSNYRYGFNGQEKSTELNDNLYAAEYWEYDARSGRRWNLDPKPNVSFSPYSVFEDNPIWHNDIKGDSTGPAPAPVKVGSMDYYVKRAQDFMKRNPGKPAPTYYLGYGNVYINKFKKETQQKLSPQGQEWLEKALVNLQTAIEDKLTKTKEGPTVENNNSKFTDFAFDTHVKAYEDAGVLALPVVDKVNILLTPKAEDLFSDRGLKQAAEIGGDQLVYYLLRPVFAVQQAKEVAANIGQITDMVHGFYLQNKKYFDEAAKTNPQGWSDPEHKIMSLVRDMIFPTFRF